MNNAYEFKGMPYVNVSIHEDDNTIRGTSMAGDMYASPATAQRWRWNISFTGGKDDTLLGNFMSSFNLGRHNGTGAFSIPVPQPLSIDKNPRFPERQAYSVTPRGAKFFSGSSYFHRGDDVIQWNYFADNRDAIVPGTFITLRSAPSNPGEPNKLYMITEFIGDEKVAVQRQHGNTVYSREVKIYPNIQWDVRNEIPTYNILEAKAVVQHSSLNTSVSVAGSFLQTANWEFIEYRG